MTRLLLTGALALALATACGSKKDDGPAQPPAEPQAPPSPTAPTPADPPAKPASDKATPEVPDRPAEYFAALRKGRTLEEKKDHAGAIAAFEKALEAWPDDARALSELSWSAFQNKDYARAKDAAQKSIDAAVRRSVKAASYYNLGRTLEAEGDTKGALEAYQTSMDLRPHKAVAKRIATLGGKPAPLVFTKLENIDDEEEPDGSMWSTELEKLSGPFVSAFMEENDNEGCKLHLRTAKGWFASYELRPCYAPNKYFNTSVAFAVEQGAGVPLLRVTHVSGERDYETTDDGDRNWTTTETNSVMLCGVGASGVPSCTAPIVTGRVETREYDDKAKPVHTDVVEIAVNKDAIEITRDGATTRQPIALP